MEVPTTENMSSRTLVHRIRNPNGAIDSGERGGTSYDVANDVVADEKSYPERIMSPDDEHRVSRSPPPVSHCRTRGAALRRTTFDGIHTGCPEWTDAITLREWMRRNSISDDVKLSPSFSSARPPAVAHCSDYLLHRALPLACMVAGAVADMHDAGVVHNDISADNIFVDTSSVGKHHHAGDDVEESEGRMNFLVEIVDFGSATLLKENNPLESRLIQGRDLYSLGKALGLMFDGGEHASFRQFADGSLSKVEADGEVARLSLSLPSPKLDIRSCPNIVRRGVAIPELNIMDTEDATDAPYLSVRHVGQDWKVPKSLATIVSKLMRREATIDTFSYRSAREVQQDLRQIQDFPERFLLSSDPEETTGMLCFPPNRLYGRRHEVSMLLDSYSRAVASGSSPEVVLISGISGTGKSTLVQQVRRPLVKRGGYFLSGKFDSLQPAEPLSTIISTFSEYCKKVGEMDMSSLNQTRTRIREMVGLDGTSVLIDLIPNLERVIGSRPISAPTTIGGREAENRLKLMLGLLVRAIACPDHPIVLFLDDLQWADRASIEVIRTLVTDTENHSLLFIGCYRDDEVDSAHPLSDLLSELELLEVQVTSIKVGNISKDAMSHLVSDTLSLLQSSARPLTDAVYCLTQGNVFFAIQFLRSLCDQGLLYFSDSLGSWHWDMEGIESQKISSTALGLMTDKILTLPFAERGALRLAACLGYHAREDILRLIADEDICGQSSVNMGTYITRMLDGAVKQGLMTKVASTYVFVHDQVQHAVYSLIPASERGLLHMQIGRRIWKRASPAQLEELLFVVVDELYLGSKFVDEDEKIELARLYLRGGKKTMSSSVFLPAATYLKAGIDLLCPGHWDDHYDLSLELYNACVEAYFLNGNFKEMKPMLEEILSHAKCFDDKLGAFRTLVNALGAQDKMKDALDAGFIVLSRLGENFPDPNDISLWYVRLQLAETREMLDGYTDDNLVAMDVMVNKQKLAAMEFLNTLYLYSYLSKQEYLPLITLRMLQLTLRYGVCKESSLAFAVNGVLLCGFFDDITRGYQFGQIALQLLDRFDTKDCLARVYVMIFGVINHWTEHIRRSLEPLLHGRQIGMMVGDIEYAMVNARIYCLCSFQCGKELGILEKDISAFCSEMGKYKQDVLLAMTLITSQAVQNLMGLSHDPLQLTGRAMDQDEMLRNALQKQNTTAVCYIHFHRMLLAYFFGNYELAADMAEKSRNIDKLCTAGFAVSNHAFFCGLTSLHLARTTTEVKWKALADIALGKMRTWDAHAPCNFRHKVTLLEAEFAFLDRSYDAARELYDLSIAAALKNDFIHEQALACERAAMFHFEAGDRSRASDYFDQAYDLYLAWGARGKAEHVRKHSQSFMHQ